MTVQKVIDSPACEGGRKVEDAAHLCPPLVEHHRGKPAMGHHLQDNSGSDDMDPDDMRLEPQIMPSTY
jgi:hypothetical protein